jgi:hypothetical protein
VKLIFNDIPQHGLLLVDPSDPFSEKVNPSLISKLQAIDDSVRDRCLALLNESDQPVVAYKLLWNLEQADGARRVDEKSFASTTQLLGAQTTEEQPKSIDDPAIKGGEFRLFSTTTRMPVRIEAKAESGGIEAIAAGMPLFPKKENTDYIRATISIDGAFYGDGRFVGPDKTGYFALIQAEVKAKLDLLHEISRQFETGGSLKKFFDQLRGESAPMQYRPHMTPSEVYSFYRQIFVDEVLRIRDVSGENGAVHLSLRELQRHWPELRKV